MIILLALAGGAFAAWIGYWRLEGIGWRAWHAALCRLGATALVLLLVLDLGWSRTPAAGGRPLVLLDASLSMGASGGRWQEARDSAARWGDVRTFGGPGNPADTLPESGSSDLRPALAAALAQDRAILVVTDGEVTDAGEIEAGLLDHVGIRLFPRDRAPGVAVVRLEGPAVVSPGDTAHFEIELVRFGGAGDTARVELRIGERTVVRRTVRFQPGNLALAAIDLPVAGLQGDVPVEAVVVTPGDAETRDNSRWVLMRVTPTPGIVVLASPPDWDSRFLHQALRDVSDLPVRGFVEMEPGVWREVERLRPVDVAEVRRAARAADLLVVKGNREGPSRGLRPRGLWVWPSGSGGEAQISGEWYAAGRAGSPVSDAFVSLPVDSFPPLGPITPIEPAEAEWVGLVAQLGRRGAERPVFTGRQGEDGRQVLTAVDGLWRWSFRGGPSETSYRALVASTVSWLLGGRSAAAGPVRPVQAVVPNGRPLEFAWNGAGAPRTIEIRFQAGEEIRRDSLRFDASGRASVRLPPGLYRYQVEGAGGLAIVEQWSSEFLPARPVLEARAPAARRAALPFSARQSPWLFGACIALFAAEWWLRRRQGLR